MSDRPSSQPVPPRRAYLIAGSVTLGMVVAVGLWTKMGYQGWGQAWVNDFSGDILYEMAWILLIGLLWHRRSSVQIAVGVFVVTAAIEFSQLIPFPASLTSNLLWRLLLGTTFVWWDFPHYALGCSIGWWLLKTLRNQYLGIKKTTRD